MPKVSDYKLPDNDMTKSTAVSAADFESTMRIGDYKMPRAGKASDYLTKEDKKYNPDIR